MTTLDVIKDVARQIIIIASSRKNGSKTWNEQPSAPKGGFTDRAGFVLMDDMECYADVSLAEQNSSLLRARLGKVVGPEGNEHFFLITLHFSANADLVKKVISHRAEVSAEMLIDVLDQKDTTPELIHVSYNTGRDSDNKPTGIRYEFSRDQMESLSEGKQEEFLKTLKSTFDGITAQAGKKDPDF